jgi:intracellular sulfur oxidation DsrE/DsrF family protein
MKFAAILGAAMLAVATLSGCATTEEPTSKVVYHVNDTAVARLAMNNVRNHLNAEPGAKIVVVTHGKGIDFLLNGTVDGNGQTYESAVAALTNLGVDFRVCANTLKARKLDEKAVMLDDHVHIVPSGVAEIGKLQAREGYVYVKP